MKKSLLVIFALSVLATSASARQVCSLRKYEGETLVKRGPVYLEWNEAKSYDDGVLRVNFTTVREDTVTVTLVDSANGITVAKASDHDQFGTNWGGRLNFAYTKPGTNLRYEVRCSFDKEGIVMADCDYNRKPNPK